MLLLLFAGTMPALAQGPDSMLVGGDGLGKPTEAKEDCAGKEGKGGEGAQPARDLLCYCSQHCPPDVINSTCRYTFWVWYFLFSICFGLTHLTLWSFTRLVSNVFCAFCCMNLWACISSRLLEALKQHVDKLTLRSFKHWHSVLLIPFSWHPFR